MRRRGGRLQLEVNLETGRDAEIDLAAKSWRWTHERAVHSRTDRATRSSSSTTRTGPSISIDCRALLEMRARTRRRDAAAGARARTQALKKLIQAAKLPRRRARARMPLLFAGDRLVAAGDRWIDASIAANDKSRRRARLSWSRAR